MQGSADIPGNFVVMRRRDLIVTTSVFISLLHRTSPSSNASRSTATLLASRHESSTQPRLVTHRAVLSWTAAEHPNPPCFAPAS